MTKQYHNLLIAACAALALPLLVGLGAQAGDGDRRHRTPPPAAFEACQGKKADDACKATFGDRTIDGKCVAVPEAQLACRPDRPRPPPEMFKACEGKQDGDACTVTFGDKARTGKCGKSRSEALICRP